MKRRARGRCVATKTINGSKERRDRLVTCQASCDASDWWAQDDWGAALLAIRPKSQQKGRSTRSSTSVRTNECQYFVRFATPTYITTPRLSVAGWNLRCGGPSTSNRPACHLEANSCRKKFRSGELNASKEVARLSLMRHPQPTLVV
jgi:hypothetical protein